LIVGEREAENNAVSVRTREGEDLGSMELESCLAYVKKKKKPGRNDEQAGG
jgi:threonyl-tRNA synthetase